MVADLNRHFGTSGAYACPCCMRPFAAEAIGTDLTIEHVPPEAIGGRPLLLTCKNCNNTAGSAWDAHAQRHSALQDAVLAGTAGAQVPVELTIGGATVRGDFTDNGDFRTIEIIKEKNNNPADFDLLQQRAREWVKNPVEIDLSLAHHTRTLRDAVVWSHIRSAYLVAFAMYGYRYALRPHFTNLRRQFANPGNEQAPPQILHHRPGTPQDTRQLFLVHEPHWLRSLAVVFGEFMVFLPITEHPSIEEIESGLIRAEQERQTLDVRELPWPEEPRYLIDGSASDR